MTDQLTPYQKLAQDALLVQDACNLSGVVRSFAQGIDVLWAEAREHGHGSDWIAHHPIVTLFIDKLASLNGSQYNSQVVFDAFDKVEELAKPKEEQVTK